MIKNMARVQVLAAERFGWAAGPSGRAGRRGVPTGLRCAVRAARRKKTEPAQKFVRFENLLVDWVGGSPPKIWGRRKVFRCVWVLSLGERKKDEFRRGGGSLRVGALGAPPPHLGSSHDLPLIGHGVYSYDCKICYYYFSTTLVVRYATINNMHTMHMHMHTQYVVAVLKCTDTMLLASSWSDSMHTS